MSNFRSTKDIFSSNPNCFNFLGLECLFSFYLIEEPHCSSFLLAIKIDGKKIEGEKTPQKCSGYQHDTPIVCLRPSSQWRQWLPIFMYANSFNYINISYHQDLEYKNNVRYLLLIVQQSYSTNKQGIIVKDNFMSTENLCL